MQQAGRYTFREITSLGAVVIAAVTLVFVIGLALRGSAPQRPVSAVSAVAIRLPTLTPPPVIRIMPVAAPARVSEATPAGPQQAGRLN